MHARNQKLIHLTQKEKGSFSFHNANMLLDSLLDICLQKMALISGNWSYLHCHMYDAFEFV